MKLTGIKSIIEKLNRNYSVVIVPNNSDSVKRISLRAPSLKILVSLICILPLAIFAVVHFSNEFDSKIKAGEISLDSMEQQVQVLSGMITEHNRTLSAGKAQMEELTASDEAIRDKLREFTKAYTEVSDNYVKTSRSNAGISNNKAISDLMKLSKMVEELNKELDTDAELRDELKASTQNLEKFIDTVPTLIPADGRITSPFGMRNHPIKKVFKEHTGVDISSSKGDPILAAASGVVESSEYSEGYGNYVIIDHKNGYRTLYGHSSKLLVKKGEYVNKGQTIALVGSTGVSTGPHLHFEIRIGNTPVDPTKYIDFAVK